MGCVGLARFDFGVGGALNVVPQEETRNFVPELINPVMGVAHSIGISFYRSGEDGQVFLGGNNCELLVVQWLVNLDELTVWQAQHSA